MTRTRIVKGKITEITGGTSKIFGNRIIVSAGENIEYSASQYTYNEPSDIPVSKHGLFDIDFQLNDDQKTIVPFGILDFENNAENPFFSFKYTLKNKNIDRLDFKITDENNEIIYEMGYLKPVIIQAKKKSLVLFEAKKTTEGPLVSKTWDYLKMLEPYILEEPDYTKIGEYHLNWDGFDNNGIYDSTRFAGKKLKAELTATKDGKIKSKTVEFETEYNQVNWTDVKIDKKAKRIDVTLRVNLTDGGAEGLEKERLRDKYSWERIPHSVLTKIGKPIIKKRTKSFKELEQLALTGLEEHWSRNHQRSVGNNVYLNSEQYEVFVKGVNTINKSMDDVDLKYSTNLYWGRSNNSGDGSTIKSVMANILEYVPYVPLNETIYYNVGYQDYNMPVQTELLRNNADWRYIDETIFYYGNNRNAPMESKEFSFTSAHELGHSILKAISEKAGGSTDYSYKHKGSSDYSDRLPVKEGGELYPVSGEIDLMKYYNNDPHRYDYDRIVAAENDVLGLIWLTKIEIK